MYPIYLKCIWDTLLKPYTFVYNYKKNALFVAVNEKNSYLCPKIWLGQLYLDYC